VKPTNFFAELKRRNVYKVAVAYAVVAWLVMQIPSVIACLLLAACTRTKAPSVAIRDVTVIDVMDGSLRAERTVLVAGNHITAIGAADEVRVPDDAEVIDAAGGYLIPGLWDMHVHSMTNVALDRSVESVAARQWHLPLFLAWGVTGVRDMNDGTGDLDLELTRSVKRRLAARELVGPRFLAAGPSLDGDPPLGSKSAIVRTAAEARTAVDRLVDGGADLVKVYENLSREAYFAIMDQAKRRRIPVDGHIPFRVTPEEAADAGQRTFEHVLAMAAGCSTEAESERQRFAGLLDPLRGLSAHENLAPLVLFRHERALYDSRDPAACAATIEAYRRNGVADTPTIVGYHHVVNAKEILSDAASMRLVPAAIRANWEARVDSETFHELQSLVRPMVSLYAENTRLLHEAGVVLLAGTDVGIPMLVPGLSLHEELVLLVKAGLTPLEALRTATLNPARVLGLKNSLGTIEPGKLADLVLLDANPLEDIHNTRKIRAVLADGRLFRRVDLDRLLAEVEAVNRPPEE
jgi:imidazolonepropionase-like amidohydrolase